MVQVIYCSRLKVEYMSHVTKSQRYTIEVMNEQGYKQKEIAKSIGKDKSVVSREISRNKDKRSGEYRSDLAQRKYEQRQKEKPKVIKFTSKVQEYVEDKLSKQWSPEQISERGKQEGLEMVSYERIYQHIIADQKKGGQLYKEKRRKKKYRSRLKKGDRRGMIKNRVGIKDRPEVVEKKERVGDYEVDLILGANHKGAIVTINERKTGYTKVQLIKSKKSKVVAKAIVNILSPYKNLIKTITSDNGKEFAEHEWISKHLELDFYFADPYSSWQRGANENYNGLLRQYFPKKTNFMNLTWREVKKAENLLNNRPRKRLNYKTPLEEFFLLTKVAFVA